MANITAAEVRYRLRTFDTVDITDAALGSASFILAGDAWIAKILENNSKSAFDDLGTNDKALAKAAEIAYVAFKVVASAPVEDHEAGPVKVKSVQGSTTEKVCAILEKEWTEMLSLIGCTVYTPSFGHSEEQSVASSSTFLS